MRVLGIDPGSNCTGFGFVEEIKGTLQAIHWSSVSSSKKDAFPKRLKCIYDELVLAIKKYKPDVVVVEDLLHVDLVEVEAQGRGLLGVLRVLASEVH